MKVSLEKVTVRVKNEKVYLVLVDGEPVGMIEKIKDTASTKHPWKAFAGIGFTRRFIGAFYPEDGYDGAAITAVLNAIPKVAA